MRSLRVGSSIFLPAAIKDLKDVFGFPQGASGSGLGSGLIRYPPSSAGRSRIEACGNTTSLPVLVGISLVSAIPMPDDLSREAILLLFGFEELDIWSSASSAVRFLALLKASVLEHIRRGVCSATRVSSMVKGHSESQELWQMASWARVWVGSLHCDNDAFRFVLDINDKSEDFLCGLSVTQLPGMSSQ